MYDAGTPVAGGALGVGALAVTGTETFLTTLIGAGLLLAGLVFLRARTIRRHASTRVSD